METESELCPFCGSGDVGASTWEIDNRDGQHDHDEFAVMCDNCGAQGPNALSVSDARRMWNLRRPMDAAKHNAAIWKRKAKQQFAVLQYDDEYQTEIDNMRATAEQRAERAEVQVAQLVAACEMAYTDLQPFEWTDMSGPDGMTYAVMATVEALREAILEAGGELREQEEE